MHLVVVTIGVNESIYKRNEKYQVARIVMKYLSKINHKDILVIIGIIVAVLIGLSTQWAMAKNPLLNLIPL